MSDFKVVWNMLDLIQFIFESSYDVDGKVQFGRKAISSFMDSEDMLSMLLNG